MTSRKCSPRETSTDGSGRGCRGGLSTRDGAVALPRRLSSASSGAAPDAAASGAFAGALPAVVDAARPLATARACAAVAALLAGLALVSGSPAWWPAGCAVVAAGVAARAAPHEAAAWGTAANGPAAAAALALAAALAAALAVRGGGGGGQLLLGAASGALCAHSCSGQAWAQHPAMALLWCDAAALAGALALGVWPRALLSTLQPLLGGFLVSSGAAALAGAALDDGDGGGAVARLPATWPEAAAALLRAAGSGAPAVQAGCAVLAALLRRATSRSAPALLCLAAGVLGPRALAGAGGDGAWGLEWPAWGCAAWAALAASGAWRHLRAGLDWDAAEDWRKMLDIVICSKPLGAHVEEGRGAWRALWAAPLPTGGSKPGALQRPFGPRPGLPTVPPRPP